VARGPCRIMSVILPGELSGARTLFAAIRVAPRGRPNLDSLRCRTGGPAGSAARNSPQ